MAKKINIILADDDKDDRLFFKKALKEVPLSTHLSIVEDGEKLIALLKKSERQLPEVIFLDINMPRKNGNECLIEMKSDEKLKHIPVIMYSTSLHEEVVDLLYQKGAHYYLQKPNVTELSKAINKILSTLLKNPQRPSRKDFVLKVG